jgi:hypothetical protein
VQRPDRIQIVGEQRHAAAHQERGDEKQDDGDRGADLQARAQRRDPGVEQAVDRIVGQDHHGRVEADARLDGPQPAAQPVGDESPHTDAEEEGQQHARADREPVPEQVPQELGVQDLVGDSAQSRKEHQRREEPLEGTVHTTFRCG